VTRRSLGADVDHRSIEMVLTLSDGDRSTSSLLHTHGIRISALASPTPFGNEERPVNLKFSGKFARATGKIADRSD
jgi:hypothetical protein